jgi:murein DD-endopeptidase MepM/ murein hydrolase activator NlpD
MLAGFSFQAASAAKPSVTKKAPTKEQRLEDKKKQVEQLKIKQKELQKKLQEITQQYQESYTKYILVEEKAKRNQQKLDEYSIELDLNQQKLDERVVAIYKNRQDLLLLEILLNFKSFNALISSFEFMAMVSQADIELVEKTKDTKSQIQERQLQLDQQQNEQKQALSEVELKQNEMKRNLDAQHMLEKLVSADIVRLVQQTTNVNGLEISIVFPVNGPHSFIDDWGFPRSGGRRHRGNDIFAQTGAPVVATTDGYIGEWTPVEKGLGGIVLWVYGYDNNKYYYAHLSKIEPGITLGSKVVAGQTIGYVGNTGNARTTPPHLHFQIHPGMGEPIDPYPFLVASDPYK